MDKLLEVYNLRITTTLKHNLEKLTKHETEQMLSEVRNVMARHVHNCAAICDLRIYQDDIDSK